MTLHEATTIAAAFPSLEARTKAAAGSCDIIRSDSCEYQILTLMRRQHVTRAEAVALVLAARTECRRRKWMA